MFDLTKNTVGSVIAKHTRLMAHLHHVSAAADPGFPWVGGGANIRFCQIFPKTAWNRKNLGAWGGGGRAPPKSATGQCQPCDNSAMMLVKLFSLKTVELFQNGVATYFPVTPLFQQKQHR